MTDRKGLTFSIAAINDTTSPRPRLETLQPTKEAQEARLAQTYQEALTELQTGNLLKAQVLLQSILQDPIILQAKPSKKENGPEPIDLNPMLQLRFSTLKNLAETLYKQDSKYHNDALDCYLQAASIDQEDVVLWNRLGTLACSLGHLNIARSAFEQGLRCSPRNWLCMEKFAEILIAIGDEEACHYIVKCLLKISPSHPRAKHISDVLEGRANACEILKKRDYFSESLLKLNVLPRGLDLLEPQHFSLSFPKKRQFHHRNGDQPRSKRQKGATVEVSIPNLSWCAILNSVLDQLQQSMGLTEANTPASQPQNLESRRVCSPADSPSVNNLIALVPKMKSKSLEESISEDDPTAMSLDKVSIVEQERSSPLQPDGLICADELHTDSCKVVPVTGDALHSTLEEYQGTEEARLEDVSISGNRCYNKQQYFVEASDPSKGAVVLHEDELPSNERRITRLERVRTRGYDKDEEVVLEKDKEEDQCEILRQLLEPFISCSSEDTDSWQPNGQANNDTCHSPVVKLSRCCPVKGYSSLDDLEVQDGAVVDEETSVQQFISEVKVNGGAYHVAHELLERLSATCCKHRIPTTNILILENTIRQFSWTTRSKQCSMFLAELCLDMFMSSPHGDSTSRYLRECDFHLCRVLEHAVLNADVTVLEGDVPMEEDNGTVESIKFGCTGHNASLAKNTSKEIEIHRRDGTEENDVILGRNHLAGKPGSDRSFKTSTLQQKVSKSEENDWSLWVRYHWLDGRWHMCRGREEEAYKRLKICLAILDRRGQLVDESPCVFLPHCKLDTAITSVTVQRKLYQLQIDKLLKHSAAKMIEQAQYAQLIDLLVPVLFPDSDSAKVKLDYVETKGGVVYSSPEYMGLDVLISACEKMTPANLRLALQCHGRKLEILCGALGIVNSGRIGALCDSLRLGRSPSVSDSRDEHVGGDGVEFTLVTEEVKLISNCASSIRDKHGESGGMVSYSIQSSLLRNIQNLLLDLMCYYIKVYDVGRSPDSSHRSFDLQFDSSSFVNTIIAFCRLQHLDVNATLKQQVSLLATVHDVLSSRGLCCAGKGCEGGEGAFLKLAIKHLGTMELKLRVTTDQQEQVKLSPSGVGGGVMEIDEIDEIEKSPEQLSEHKDEMKGLFAIEASKSKRKKPEFVKDEEAEQIEQRRVQLGLDSVLDQCFFCLYGLNLRGGFETSSQLDGLSEHKNTNRGEYQTKEQCAGVYQYVLPYAKACTRPRLLKLRKVLRAIYKQFPCPPPHVLAVKSVDPFLDDPEFEDERFSDMVLSCKSVPEILDYALQLDTSVCKQQEMQGFRPVHKTTDSQSKQLEMYRSPLFENGDSVGSGNNSQTSITSGFSELPACKTSSASYSEMYADQEESYLEVYENLYYFVSEVEDTSASDKWAGFVLTKEGEEFVEQNAKIIKYDLCYNPLRFESWFKLAKIYDEEVDLLLNDGSKNINVVDWKGNNQLTARVEMSRQRTRRCLLMALALSNTPEKQSEMHELLALVSYDSIQNVAPSYDQRRHVPKKDATWVSLCEKAFKHFERAFAQKPDWTHLFYMGKLSEKLCRPSLEVFDFYKKAVDMNSSAVDPLYRLHASRLKLLCGSDGQDVGSLQVIAQHCYVSSIKERLDTLFGCLVGNSPDVQASSQTEPVDIGRILLEIRKQLFEDCLTVMKVCVEGELKHYHKARFRLAHGLYSNSECQDMDRAKEELAFCFRSSRSLFTINMWEIDSNLRKIKRKAAHQTNLDVQMPESSRKFISCVRKYLILYLTLCERTGDIYTLERAFSMLKTDKKFSLSLDDLSRVALGKYIQALAMAICQADANDTISHSTLYSLLERLFNLFMDYGTTWSEALQISLAEAQVLNTSEVSEGSVYGYIHRYLGLLENEVKLDTLEAINDRIRKRFKNFKLVGSQTSQICRHACLAWCRALCYALASITPLPQSRHTNPIQVEANSTGDQVLRLIVDLQEDIFMTSSYELPVQREESRDNANCVPLVERRTRMDVAPDSASLISCIKAVVVRHAAVENLERASALLRSTYVFYRDSSSGPFPGGINLFRVAGCVPEGSNCGLLGGITAGAEALDISTPRKLLLWAFTLVHGRTGTVSEAVKFCEEQAKENNNLAGLGWPGLILQIKESGVDPWRKDMLVWWIWRCIATKGMSVVEQSAATSSALKHTMVRMLFCDAATMSSPRSMNYSTANTTAPEPTFGCSYNQWGKLYASLSSQRFKDSAQCFTSEQYTVWKWII